jgi:hypothetical protein
MPFIVQPPSALRTACRLLPDIYSPHRLDDVEHDVVDLTAVMESEGLT